ncbi:GNAT family N-acetyltransferase [Yoonia sp.]|uniref:GNAT family N-acetyltransferase n=1 Tax=Yoonia sp. TaxID=2212373 RepID=UPI0019F8AEB6|nr:GNAT family N-acetyltransferase [Yoonia sp.]MBE0412038.1 GNAT family N-acetyltransferase [Yoonia sp.]
MPLPDAQMLFAVIDGTWPATAKTALGPWTIRLDPSDSSRVSAATAEQAITDADVPQAEMAMRTAGQIPLFMIREGDDTLDALLAARGYLIKDPVRLYAALVADIATQRPPPVTTFDVWPPLAVQNEIWAMGGLGAARLAIMQRAPHPKTTILGRMNDRPAGTVFVGTAGTCAMIHALEIAKPHRRQGLAKYMMRAAAFWAQAQGMDFLTLATTQANKGANALYASLGMTVVGHYHYRILPGGNL